jgi:hypothetical protein
LFFFVFFDSIEIIHVVGKLQNNQQLEKKLSIEICLFDPECDNLDKYSARIIDALINKGKNPMKWASITVNKCQYPNNFFPLDQNPNNDSYLIQIEI